MAISWTSLVPAQPCGSTPPFFYVPPAASTALGAARYARYLGKDQPVYGLQPLGFEEGEVPHDRIKDIAAYYLSDIQRFQPKGPYYLCGPCFGAWVAFEMAQQLYAQGSTVALLALLDYGVPGYGVPGHCVSRKNGVEKISYYARRTIYEFKYGNLAQALTARFVSPHNQRIRKKITCLLGKPQDRRIQRIQEAHQAAQIKYQPKVYPGKITLFQNSKYHALEKQNFWEKHSWSDLAAGGFECHVIQGDHLEIFQEPRFQELATQLKDCLEKAQAEHPLSVLPPESSDPQQCC